MMLQNNIHSSNTTYVSERASEHLKAYLRSRGRRVETVRASCAVGSEIADHPDIFMCRLGARDDSPLIIADEDELGPVYPADIPYNAACTGIFFIHNTKYTAPRLLEAAAERGMTTVDVKQGYAKCSTVVVDEHSIITYDGGIASACADHSGLDVLLVDAGHVALDGFPAGFLGGASGRVGSEIIFNGDLTAHPDFARIKDFIEARALKCTWFEDFPLTDIGSII